MSGPAVHTASGRRLGVADPRQEGPLDLRLVPPALAAWAAAALALDAPGRWVAVGVALAACAALGIVGGTWAAGRADRARGPGPGPGRAGVGVGAPAYR
ncbi:competence protein ComEC, partial [Streptomyces sp. PalvLS-984]